MVLKPRVNTAAQIAEELHMQGTVWELPKSNSWDGAMLTQEPDDCFNPDCKHTHKKMMFCTCGQIWPKAFLNCTRSVCLWHKWLTLAIYFQGLKVINIYQESNNSGWLNQFLSLCNKSHFLREVWHNDFHLVFYNLFIFWQSLSHTHAVDLDHILLPHSSPFSYYKKN